MLLAAETSPHMALLVIVTIFLMTGVVYILLCILAGRDRERKLAEPAPDPPFPLLGAKRIGSDWLIIYKHPTDAKYKCCRGSGTVWYHWPGGRRCSSNWLEDDLADTATRAEWGKEEFDPLYTGVWEPELLQLLRAAHKESGDEPCEM